MITRRKTIAGAAASLVALLAGVSAAEAGNGTPVDQSKAAIDIAVIGDVPYGADAYDAFPALIDDINADPKVRVAVHVGDIKSGSTQCTDEWNDAIRASFDTFEDPLIYSVGDNEWTDCHRANNGGYDPLDRLDDIRSTFFDNPGQSLGGRKKAVDAQDDYPENQLWFQSQVAFATVHEIGSNNGLDEWFTGDGQTPETPDQTAARIAEVEARTDANVAWLEHTFETAEANDAAGVAIFLHADMYHPGDRAELGGDEAAQPYFAQHTAVVQALSDLAADFGKPVLLVDGDSHNYVVREGVPWFSLYDVDPQPNITQVVIDRSIEDDSDWLRLHVDPRSDDVFSWTQEFVG